jgi:hypothetical protein
MQRPFVADGQFSSKIHTRCTAHMCAVAVPCKNRSRSICPAWLPIALPLQLLLSQEYDDDWLDNPVVGGSWGLTWAFKEQWDDAMQVVGGGGGG